MSNTELVNPVTKETITQRFLAEIENKSRMVLIDSLMPLVPGMEQQGYNKVFQQMSLEELRTLRDLVFETYNKAVLYEQGK